MDPELLLTTIRQDHERLANDVARQRMAAELTRPRRPGLPRRTLGRLLVRAGLWLMVSRPATPARSLD